MIKTRSLGARLLTIFIPLVTVTLVTLFFVLEYQYYQNKRTELRATISDLAAVQGPAIAAAVWEYDTKEVVKRVTIMGELEYVSHVIVKDQFESVLASYGGEEEYPEDPAFTVEIDLLFEDESTSEALGRLQVIGNPGLIHAEVLAHIQVQIGILAVLIVVLSLGTFYATRRVITHPLESLKNAMNTSATTGSYTPVTWSRTDEIGRLVSAYNDMQVLRAKAEQELVSYQSQLETRVEERTAEVEHKSALLEAVLGSINQGLVAYDEELMLIISNQRFRDIRDIPEELTQPGASFIDWVEFDAERGEFGDGDPEQQIHDQVVRAKEFVSHTFERTRPDGTIIEVVGGPLPNGGFVSTFTDITVRRNAEKSLSNAYHIISDSINYASRIQRSVLPDGTLFQTNLKDHFVFWEPRDVVGGDMYWSRIWGDRLLIVLGDCTGHGVPGAFMTLISTGALDGALSDVAQNDLPGLMQRLHQLIQITLGQHASEGESDDGMDVAMCLLDTQMEHLTFVGARLELTIVENDSVHTIKGTKSGVGYRGISQTQEFEANHITELTGKSIYLTTDGIIDQIGGPRRRMFGKKRLRELLLHNQHKSMSDQHDAIRAALEDYQGEELRRDDVAVIGFKM